MSPSDRIDGAPWRNIYIRRNGRKLRKGQAGLVENRLSELAPPGVGWEENPDRDPIDLKSLFPGKHEIWLEIGFGGGEHMLSQAQRYPDTGIIGAETFINGVAKLLAAVERANISNVSITDADARDVLDVLPPASISRVFLLYPDPWPKSRHHKRRFMNPSQLNQLASVMAPGAHLRVATDIFDYVRHSIEAVTHHPSFEWTAATAQDWLQPWDDWPGTRYEAKALRENRRPTYLTFARL